MAKLKRYPGSKPFTIAEKGLFFGRDEDIEGLFNFINVEKLSVLYGKSGLGKTSLLEAGVIPKLKKEKNYLVIPVRFGSNSSRQGTSPKDLFVGQIDVESDTDNFLLEIQSEEISLWQHIKSIELAHPENQHILLEIDQFEELFTYPEGDVDAFSKELSLLLGGKMPLRFKEALRRKLEVNPDFLSDEDWAFLKQPLHLKVILSIRSDKLNLLNRMSRRVPYILRNCYELLPLTRSQAKDAIVQPALNDKLEFVSPPFTYKAETLKKILDYLTQEGSKPIESFQLQILCQYIEENIVLKNKDTLIDAEDLGDLEKIYQNYYDYHIENLDNAEDQEKARLLIEERLILEKDERRLSLYKAQFEDLEVSNELLEKLENTHIIRAVPVPGQDNVYFFEISHDTLVSPILKSKTRRKAKEKAAEAKRIAQKRQRRQLITIGIIGAAMLVFFIAFLWVGKLYNDADNARKEAEKISQAGKLIIRSLQLEDDATIALRLAERAYNLDTTNQAILEIMGKYYAENAFYKEVFTHNKGLGAIAFSPDNTQVLTGSDDHSARLWNIEGKEIACLIGHKGPVKMAIFHPSGKYILTGSSDQRAILWDKQGKQLQILDDHESTVYALAFSKDGTSALTGDGKGAVILWRVDLQSNTLIEERKLQRHDAMVLALAFSPNGNQILTSDLEGRIFIWNRNGVFVKEISPSNRAAVNAASFSPNGQDILIGTADRRVLLLDNNGREKRAFPKAHSADISAVAFSPTGDSILTGSQDKMAILWNKEGEILQKFKGHTRFIRFAAFSPNGKYILTSSDDHTAKLWEIGFDNLGASPAAAPSSDETMLQARSESRTYQVFALPDTNTALLVTSIRNQSSGDRDTAYLEGHTDQIIDVAFPNSGIISDSLVLTVSKDETARLWGTKSGSERYFFQHNGLLAAMFDPSNPNLLTAGEDKTARLWNIASGTEVYVYKGHSQGITAINFSHDGKYILTGGKDHQVIQWTRDGKPLKIIAGQGTIKQVAFSANGDSILTTEEDGTVRKYFSLQGSLAQGGIARLGLHHQVEFGLLRNQDSIQAAIQSMTQLEELREYAYFLLTTSADSNTFTKKVNTITKAAEIFGNRILKFPNRSSQDSIEAASIYVSLAEAYFRPNQDDRIQNIQTFRDSALKYNGSAGPALAPILIAAYAMEDSIEKADGLSDQLVENQENLIGILNSRIKLINTLTSFQVKFKSEEPEYDISKLTNYTDSLRFTFPEKTEFETQAEAKQIWNYYIGLAVKTRNERQKIYWYERALNIHKPAFDGRSTQEVFDTFRTLGDLYVKPSKVNQLTNNRRFNIYLSIFNAYIQTGQFDRRKSYLSSKTSPELVRNYAPAIRQYINYWIENGFDHPDYSKIK